MVYRYIYMQSYSIRIFHTDYLRKKKIKKQDIFFLKKIQDLLPSHRIFFPRHASHAFETLCRLSGKSLVEQECHLNVPVIKVLENKGSIKK